jgi:hypothetical protein
VEFTKVVAIETPFQRTEEDAMKPVPMTRRIRLDPEVPASCRSVITGVGFVDPEVVVVGGGVVVVLPPPPPQLMLPSTSTRIAVTENARCSIAGLSQGKKKGQSTTLVLRN